MGNYTFDRALLPLPDKTQMTFCSNNPQLIEFITKIDAATNEAFKAILAALIVCAIVILIPVARFEMWKWNRLQKSGQNLPRDDPITAIEKVKNPILFWISGQISRLARMKRRKNVIYWFVAYISSPVAFFVFSLGFVGLVSCLSQQIALSKAKNQTKNLQY
ncbi:MAG: hypothetical protein O7C62_04355, partial [Rickettsia endosymbiont of Ixodes persulcatus]|nr:hypothetical protein [Rickettsia endosymbiont of Ixodes persulcatus]